jgi:hypothetical protein
MYSATLSLTLAVDGGGWLMPCYSCFTPGDDLVPIVYEAGWVQKILPAPGFDPWTAQPIVGSCTDCVVPAQKKS